MNPDANNSKIAQKVMNPEEQEKEADREEDEQLAELEKSLVEAKTWIANQ